jgi:hypothetical protein
LTSNEKGNDKLIAFNNGTIYKANPKTDEETDMLARDLKPGFFNSTKLWDDKEHWLEIREKDEGYRQQVIKFLTGQ